MLTEHHCTIKRKKAYNLIINLKQHHGAEPGEMTVYACKVSGYVLETVSHQLKADDLLDMHTKNTGSEMIPLRSQRG